MGLENRRCDSCEEEVDLLFPISILEKSAGGIEVLVPRFYCAICFADLLSEAKLADKEEPEDGLDSDSALNQADREEVEHV